MSSFPVLFSGVSFVSGLSSLSTFFSSTSSFGFASSFSLVELVSSSSFASFFGLSGRSFSFAAPFASTSDCHCSLGSGSVVQTRTCQKAWASQVLPTVPVQVSPESRVQKIPPCTELSELRLVSELGRLCTSQDSLVEADEALAEQLPWSSEK